MNSKSTFKIYSLLSLSPACYYIFLHAYFHLRKKKNDLMKCLGVYFIQLDIRVFGELRKRSQKRWGVSLMERERRCKNKAAFFINPQDILLRQRNIVLCLRVIYIGIVIFSLDKVVLNEIFRR